MSDNWLSTAGSWLATPVKLVFGPWWEKYVGSKAESVAVRQKILEAAVRFRVRDFCKGRNIDSDKELGIASRIVERLAAVITGDKNLDVTNADFLKRIEGEVHLHGVPQTTWMQIACLAETEEFNPNNAIIVEFTDEKGNQSHGSAMIASLQSIFPFWQLLHIQNMTSAKLSPDALHDLEAYISRHIVPEVRFEIADQVPQFGELSCTNTLALPARWRPNRK